MARIVILSSGPLCRNPRVLKEASALGAAGHVVTVLTIARSFQDEQQDESLLATAPFGKQVVDLVAEHGMGPSIRRFVTRANAYLARRMPDRSWGAHALGPVGTMLRAARRIPADLFIAHTELPMVVAVDLMREGRVVAVDFEDWHSRDLLPAERIGRPLRLIEETEACLLQQAAGATTTSAAMAAALFSAYGGQRPEVIRNVFPLQPLPARKHAELPAFVWFSQTIGPGRGLEAFLAAWSRAQRHSRLVLIGRDNGYGDTLLRLCPRDAASRLTIRPPVPAQALPALIAEHHIGLALEPSSPPNRDLTISNKLFQYLNAGLGVLATPTAGQCEIATRFKSAIQLVDLESPDQLSAEIDQLLAAPDRMAMMGRAARQAAEDELCWEREAPRLVQSVQQVLAGARLSP